MTAFRHPLRVRYAECDPQKVVFNGHYLFYFDVAVTELWREAIGPYDEAMAEHDVDIVVAEATVRYREPLRFDDEFDLAVEIPHLGTTSMRMAIACERDGAVCADGELRQVFVRTGPRRRRRSRTRSEARSRPTRHRHTRAPRVTPRSRTRRQAGAAQLHRDPPLRAEELRAAPGDR